MRASIRLKLVVPLVLGLALIAVATAGLMRFVHLRAVEQAARHELEHAAEALASQEERELDRLLALTEAIGEDDALAQRLARRDVDGLLAKAAPLFRRLREGHGVTHWYFHDPDPARGVLLRVHRPELRGDRVSRPSFLRAVETGQPASGREFGQTALAVRVVRPWRLDGRLIGYLELGSDIQSFLGRLKKITGDDYGMLLDKRKLDRAEWAAASGGGAGWDDRTELVAVGATGDPGALFGAIGRLADIPRAPTLLERLKVGEQLVARGIFPLRREDGELLGGVAVLNDITPLLGGVADLRLRVVLLVVLLAGALGALVVFLLETLVFERVERASVRLEQLPERLAQGEPEPAEEEVRAGDELGRLESSLDQAVQAGSRLLTDARRTQTNPGGLPAHRRRPPRGDR